MVGFLGDRNVLVGDDSQQGNNEQLQAQEFWEILVLGKYQG